MCIPNPLIIIQIPHTYILIKILPKLDWLLQNPEKLDQMVCAGIHRAQTISITFALLAEAEKLGARKQ